MPEFHIDVRDLCWIKGAADDPEDLCLHGQAVAVIGEETFEYEATVSAAALYLLKSLTEDHIIYHDNQLLPCCGFFLIANEDLTQVDISGCPNGVDWSVIHEGNMVKLITETEKTTCVTIEEYRDEVFAFADKIEEFYKKCQPKILPEDPFDRDGYTAFWNEWHRRRLEGIKKNRGFDHDKQRKDF